MTLSPQMENRITKIDKLQAKGFAVKTKLNGFIPVLIDKEGKAVSYYGENEDFPGFSWIAFLFGPFVAVQIRDWNYFWYLGICEFISHSSNLIPFFAQKQSFFSLIFGIVIAMGYAYIFPYQRWFFNKSNKKEILRIKSIFIGVLLCFVAVSPSTVLFGN